MSDATNPTVSRLRMVTLGLLVTVVVLIVLLANMSFAPSNSSSSSSNNGAASPNNLDASDQQRLRKELIAQERKLVEAGVVEQDSHHDSGADAGGGAISSFFKKVVGGGGAPSPTAAASSPAAADQQQQEAAADNDGGDNAAPELRPIGAAAAASLIINVGGAVATSDAFRELNASFPRLASGTTSVAGNGLLTIKMSRVASMDTLREGTELGKQMRACSSQYRGGHFFDAASRQCKPHDGFFTPLKSFEISVEEMSCSPDSFYERFRNPQHQYRWIDFPFVNFSDANGVLDHFGIDQSVIATAAAGSGQQQQKSLARRYSRWMFFTSWAMRQWLPYTPLPVKSSSSSSSDDTSSSSFSAFHDPSVENLYVIRNFCVAPYGGISGYKPSRFEKYKGLLDERSKFHTKDSDSWRSFLKKVSVLSSPPDFFDERPVVFLPRLPMAHPNIHHSFVRFLTTLGILDLPAFSNNAHEPETFASSSSSRNEFDYSGRSSTTEHWNSRQGVKPLIVIPYTRITRKKLNADRVRVTVYAFFLRALDLPYAIINMRNDADDLISAQFAFAKHSGASSSSASSSGSKLFDTAPSASFCARRAVVYQGCLEGCDWTRPHEDKEVYSFGAFSRLSSSRAAMLSRFVRVLRNCLPISAAVPIASAATPVQLQLPRLFFNVRSGHRTLAHLPLIAEDIHRGLRNFVSEIRFREPWRGSRAQYINDIRASNIWFGVHGGAFAEVIHLPRRSVVLELSARPFQCLGGAIYGATPRDPACWFQASAQFTQSSHWIMSVKQAGFQGGTLQLNKTLQLPSHVLVAWLRDAVCAWYHNNAATRKMPNEVVRLYCKYFSPAVNLLGGASGATRYRSDNVFLDRDAANVFATDVDAVVRCLRDEFGIELADHMSAVRFVERLRSLNSKLPRMAKLVEQPGTLKSEAPLLFEVLIQRFVDVAVTVAPVTASRGGGVFRSGNALDQVQVVCLESVIGAGEKVCLYMSR